MKVEYQVKELTRYTVTRWYSEAGPTGDGGGCIGYGEFDNANQAYEVATSMASNECLVNGWAIDDERMKFPLLPTVQQVNNHSGQRNDAKGQFIALKPHEGIR